MVEPVSLAGATLATLAASKFVESAAKQLGDVVTPAVIKRASTQIDAMWARMKQHFTGNKKAENAIVQIETAQSPEALSKLAVYLDDDLQEPQNQALADELRQMVQQIINIGQQQTATTFNIDARDEARVNAIGGDVNATTVNFGDGPR